MPVHLKLDGVATLSEALRGLPADLRDHALGIVRDHVDRAESEIRSAYPEGETGNLRSGLRQDTEGSSLAFGARVVLKNTAKHAFLFETGSEYKHPDLAWVRRTRKGIARGRMPAGKIFIPAVIRWRRRMVEALVSFVERAGFTVKAA
jgi:hypothetical protein